MKAFLMALIAISNAASIRFPSLNVPKTTEDELEDPIEETIIGSDPEADQKALLELQKEQNRKARYQFSHNIEDHISDLTHTRMETRNGLAVEGSYSYSDGFTKRIVHYVADENGYRVVRMEAIPLNESGPQVDLHGVASVSAQTHGNNLQYRVQSVPVPGPIAKVVDGDKMILEKIDEKY